MTPGIRQRAQERMQRWMLRGRAPERLPVTLGQRRIYVLPTGPGLSFAALLLAMLVASLNYNLALGFALTFMLAGVGHLSMIRAHRNLLGVSLKSGRCDAVFAGAPRALLAVLADTATRARPALWIRSVASEACAVSIPAGSEAIAAIALPSLGRGWHRVGRLRLETRYPLGLVVAWSYFEPDLGGPVYPTPEPDPPVLPAQRGEGEGQPAPGLHGTVFDSLRPYREGDSPRRVAWRLLARGGALATKHFESESGGERWLRWEDSAASLGVEARLSRLCAWALQLDKTGGNWGLELPGHHIPPGSGEAHLREALEALARFEQTPDD